MVVFNIHTILLFCQKCFFAYAVKPKNIVLDADGHCVIVDFGFAVLSAPPSDR